MAWTTETALTRAREVLRSSYGPRMKLQIQAGLGVVYAYAAQQFARAGTTDGGLAVRQLKPILNPSSP